MYDIQTLTVIQTTITFGDNLVEYPLCHIMQTESHELAREP